MSIRVRGAQAAILAAAFLWLAACGKKEDPRWAEAQKKADRQLEEQKEARKEGTLPKATEGGALNKFFPRASDGYDRVASQEKEGFAEYKLKKGGKEMAMLAISDISSNPQAADKFKTSSRTIGGFPAVEQGSMATAVLVNNRYQVKALSRDPSFSKADREAWLAKFDLQGLATLK